MKVVQGHPYLQLEIDGMPADILAEQKPTLFSNGYIYVHPDEKWSELLPVIEIITEGDHRIQLKSFIRSKVLIPIIIEMCHSVDVRKFNKKWTGKVINEDHQ